MGRLVGRAAWAVGTGKINAITTLCPMQAGRRLKGMGASAKTAERDGNYHGHQQDGKVFLQQNLPHALFLQKVEL
jgi:hypothetical protein